MALENWHILGVVDIEPVFHLGDIALVATLVGGYLALKRFRQTLKQSIEEQRSAHYSELDHFYAEILRAGIETPHLRMPEKLVSDADALERDYFPFLDGDRVKRSQYETYAYMVWNFIETIHDRCVDNAELKGTWTPVIRAESEIHRGWFLAELRKESLRQHEYGSTYRNTHKFCEEFRIFVVERQWDEPDWAYRRRWRSPPTFGH